MPFPIAEVIGAAGTIGATATNAAMQGKMNKKTRWFARDQFVDQRNTDRDNWAMQNEYNLPKNQMKRLRDAGLNPALVYGSGATTLSANVDSHAAQSWNPEAPQIDAGVVGSALQNVYKGKTMGVQESILQQNLKNQQAQEKMISASTLEILQRTKNLATAGEKSKFDLAIDQELRNYTVSERKSKAHQASTIVDKLMLDNNIKSGELSNQATRQKLENAYIEMSTKQKQKAIDQMEAAIKKMNLESDLLDREKKLNESGTQKTDPYWFRVLLSMLFPSSD